MKQRIKYLTALALLAGSTGCYKELVTKEKDYFSNNMNFSQDNYQVTLGRINAYTNIFNADNSRQPLEFTMENFRHSADSTPAPELQQNVETRQWKTYYDGMETSLAELTAKWTMQAQPVLYMRPHSGEIFFYNTDSTKVKPGLYKFDVRVRNSGGEKLFKNFTLQVLRPRPYEPYEFDNITGERKAPDNGGILRPDGGGIQDEQNNAIDPKKDIIVYIKKAGTAANTISYKFFDKDSLPIRLSHFNTTQWDSLKYYSGMANRNVLFGFKRRMLEDSTVVTYDIPNPFPVLADVSNGSENAGIRFSYNRVSFGSRWDASIGFTCAIYEPGEWQVIFKFTKNPKFRDD